MKKILKILLMITICFGIFSNYTKKGEIDSLGEICTRQLSDEKTDRANIIFDPIYAGGGGLANRDVGAYGNGSNTGGGGSLLFLCYYLTTSFWNSISGLFSKSVSVPYSSSPTINDLYGEAQVHDAMSKYGWSKDLMTEWLGKMIGTSVTNFMNDDKITIYLGSTHDSFDYSSYRDIDNHIYTFSTDEYSWKLLVENICNNNYEKIWVLNMVFLQMCIIKNATFILVSPTYLYFDYSKNSVIPSDDGYIPFYASELAYIHNNGYNWYDYYSHFVRTSRSTPLYA